MYKRKTISRKLLSAGLFLTAYGMDQTRGDEEVVCELFVFCAILLERNGWDIDKLLCGIDENDYERGSLIADFVDRMDEPIPASVPDCSRLVRGLHELLCMQFSDTEHLERRRFLDDLSGLSRAR